MNKSDLPRRFRTQVQDHALFPRLSSGDLLEMRTDLQAQAGDIALLCDSKGAPMLRVLREKTPGAYIAVALNDSFAALDVRADDLTILAIAVAEVRILRRE